MTQSRAPYMEWAKKRPLPAIDLAGSNLLACSLSDLPGAREAVDIAGESPDGYAPLVEAIATHSGVSPERVATAGGCSGANFLAIAALVEAGEEVLIESPNYDPIPGAARLIGAGVSTFERRFEEGYRLDPERIAAAIGPETRLIVVTNPHNPSGVLAAEEELAGLARVAERTGTPVLFDEVYLDTVLDDRPAPAATRSPLFLTTSSLTKAYGLASLRCGWILSSEEITRRILRTRNVMDVWSPIPSDRLSVVAFGQMNRLAQRTRRIVEANTRLVRAFLAGRPELSCVESRSTIAFPRLLGVADASEFVRRLFEQMGVALVPGSFFDSPAHFRIGFGGATDPLERGLAAIGRALEQGGSA
jgi:aspartate/methionine/tyrosine aminotransferase